MEFSPLSKEQKKSILSKTKNSLVTQRCIRTLSPEDPRYIGYSGERHNDYNEAAHQGTVYPYLLFPFIKTYLGVHKAGGLAYVKQLLENFKEVMSENCIGTISESYEGNPPFTAKGSISQAWNISAILLSNALVEKVEQQIFLTTESNQ